MASAPTKFLVRVEELAAHPEWRIFDCRHDLTNLEYGRSAYNRGHIPGALFLHLDEDLSGTRSRGNGRHPLPQIDDFVERMSACGVDESTQVVAYDNEGGIFASRVWWMLRWLGHERVAVLDGGLAGWKRSGRTLEESATKVEARQFKASPQDMTVDSGQVLADLHSQRMLVVDARSPERFRGQNETLDPVGGHIPGAVNRFYFENLDDDGCYFKPSEELRKEFAAMLGDRPAASVVQQCGSGVTACHNLLAMELAGFSGSKLYPGSWSEWCADPSRPVATD
ncbi:MAG: sulfurtransferase [Sulfuritalea sp.]|nr:sulfurtransferase [Sulfuritalea sp.]